MREAAARSQIVLCRAGETALLGEFEWAGTEALRAGDGCVVRTDRGTELAVALDAPHPARRSEARARAIGAVLRRAGDADLAAARARSEEALGLFRAAHRTLARLGLPGRLASVEVPLGRERAIVYVHAPGASRDLRPHRDALALVTDLPLQIRLFGQDASDLAPAACDRPDCPKKSGLAGCGGAP